MAVLARKYLHGYIGLRVATRGEATSNRMYPFQPWG